MSELKDDEKNTVVYEFHILKKDEEKPEAYDNSKFLDHRNKSQQRRGKKWK